MSFELRRRRGVFWNKCAQEELLFIDFEKGLVMPCGGNGTLAMSQITYISPAAYRTNTVPVTESELTPEDLFRCSSEFLIELKKVLK